MDWPFNYHSKGRPTEWRVLLWSLAYFILVFGFLCPSVNAKAKADSSPPVADVEDLFKDEGFLRMSRGGEAFGRRPPPPPLILNPPHLSTQPPRPFPTSSPNPKDKIKPPSIPPPRFDNGGAPGDKFPLENVNSNLANRSSSHSGRVDDGQGSDGGNIVNGQGSKPLEKDVSAVFSKVGSGGTVPGSSGGQTSGTGESGGESDAHPLLGITPAAPGEAFDFNPILSNPAVTRILAGSSGRIPQWEPTLPDLHDLIPEVNYTADTSGSGNRGFSNAYNPSQQGFGNSNNPVSPGTGSGSGSIGHGLSSGNSSSNNNGPISNNNNAAAHSPMPHNPKNPIFVPSPVSSKSSPTMYNMDQMTNNIAIPKHTLPNPSNLATSRSTFPDDGGDNFGQNNRGSAVEERDREGHPERYNPNSGSMGSNNHLEESRGEGGNLYYDEEDSGLNEESRMGSNFGEVQGKRGIKGEAGQNGQDHSDSRDENGPKYVVCDALCGAWKHQCKLMGILFSITSALCIVFAFAVLYSLHFGLKDFAPFSVILLFLFVMSASRAFTLLSGWLCSPDSRPTWLPIVSTLPAAFLTITFLAALHFAHFPFPFVKSYSLPSYIVLILSVVGLVPPLGLSLGAYLHPPSHGVLSQVAWIFAHIVLAFVSLAYLLKFKSFYSRLANERSSSSSNGAHSSSILSGNCMPMSACSGASNHGNNNLSSFKKRGYAVKWGCLQARAMFGAALLALSLSTMIIISVAMSRGECEATSTWTGWVLSLCARMLEFAIVILLLLVSISSADVRFLRLTRVPINKSNVGLINADIFPTMVSSNTAVQRCIPMYSSNARADVMMLGPTENRSSLRGKTFGERALPGERMGEYRSSTGRGLPLRLGNGPSQSLPGTPVDGFPQGLRLPEPAPASLLVTKVVFGTPAVSREVNLNHQHENPLLCTGGPASKDERETSNIYASLESVKVASVMNAGSSTGSNHSGSDRVLLSAPRDYIYSISRDLTKTIDSIYDTSRPRSNNLAHTIETLCPPLAHTIEQIGSIPNLNGGQPGRAAHFNFHPHGLHHPNGTSLTPGRTDLTRTIDRIRYAAAAAPPTALTTPTSTHPGRNFVLQLGTPGSNIPGMGNPPPYCSSESSHDVTPDSGFSKSEISTSGSGSLCIESPTNPNIALHRTNPLLLSSPSGKAIMGDHPNLVSDIHSKTGRMEIPEVVYAREYRRNSMEDVRRLPLLPLPRQHRTPGATPLYDRTPTSPTNPSSSSSPAMHPGVSPLYASNPAATNTRVGRVELLLNQTEHILSRTESLDSNSHSAGLQRLLSHKEQLEHVERLLAQAEYAIWLEKRNCAQQVSQLGPADSVSPYGYSQGSNTSASVISAAAFSPSANGSSPSQPSVTPLANPMVVNSHSVASGSTPPNHINSIVPNHSKKMSKTLEEESVV